jgi:hypothetical protein
VDFSRKLLGKVLEGARTYAISYVHGSITSSCMNFTRGTRLICVSLASHGKPELDVALARTNFALSYKSRCNVFREYTQATSPRQNLRDVIDIAAQIVELFFS